MNKVAARKIAETITNLQLKEMFENAKANIKDWTKISDVNKGMTKGTSWNILAKVFDVNKTHHILVKRNMVWEFGDYLPNELKIKKKSKNQIMKDLVHQNPDFSDFDFL